MVFEWFCVGFLYKTCIEGNAMEMKSSFDYKDKRDVNLNDSRVIVAGRNYCSNLCMARSMGLAGYEVEVLRVFTQTPKWYNVMKYLKPDAYSKYVNGFHVCVSDKDGHQIIEQLLELADPAKKTLLVPADDFVANTVDAHYDELSKLYVMSSIGKRQNAINYMMNKSVQKELALAAGLPVVGSHVIWAKNGEFDIPETVTYPCFIKPNISKNGRKAQMQKCDTKAELRAALTKLSRKKELEVLIEDYIEIEKEYSILGVSTSQTVIGPGFFRAEMGGHKERRGVALIGEVLSSEEYHKLIDQIVQFINTLDFEGLFDVDLLEDVNGNMYFVELNMRFGGSGYAITQSGVNLPGMFADYMVRNKPINNKVIVENTGKTFISEKIMLEEYINGYLSWSEMKNLMDKADIFFIRDENDVEPYRHFKRYMFAAFFVKQAKRVKTKIRVLKRKIRRVRSWLKKVILRYPQMKKANRRNPDAKLPRVVVAGRNYCSNLCMARAIGRAGYEVEILRLFKKRPRIKELMKQLMPDAYSKYVKAYHVCILSGKEERVVRRLKNLADPNRKMLLVPVDDLVANIIDDYLDELSEFYLISNVDGCPGAINRMMSKGVQKELALKAGLPVVNSCVIKSENGEFEIPSSVTYPCFMKPNISKNGLKSTMQKCENEEELIAALTELAQKKDIEILVEDYVEIEREYSILGLSTKDGVIGPGFFGAEKGGHKERRGVALTGKVRPCEEHEELINKILEFIGTLNFEGLFDVDLLETKDGKMYFIELNLRFGGSGYAITQSGVNLPGMFADYMVLGKPIDLNCKIERTGSTFVSEKIMIEEYLNGFLTMDEMKHIMKESDIHFIKDESDKKPYRHFRKFYLVALLLRFKRWFYH